MQRLWWSGLMFADGNNKSSPGLRALLGRFLHGLLPHRLFQLVGAVWSYLMGPWEASSLLPSGWLVHRSVHSAELPEVLEVLGLRPGSWEELGECLDELGPWKELLSPEVELDLLKSWKGVSSIKGEESEFPELSTWQKALVHSKMQLYWEQGLTSWKDAAELNKDEKDCHKAASASQTFPDQGTLITEPCKEELEKSGTPLQSSSLSIISYILNVGMNSGAEWKDEHNIVATEDNPSQNLFEIQHIRNKRLRFLQQNQTREGFTAGVKQEYSEREQNQTIVPEIPDPVGLSPNNQPVSNVNLDLSVSECLESQIIYEQCELLSDVGLTQGDVLVFPETFDKFSSCDQLPVVGHEVSIMDDPQHICPSSPDKDQGYHSLEYWPCHSLQQEFTTANIETSKTCELDRDSVLSALSTNQPTCASFVKDTNDDQNSEDIDSDLQDEFPVSPVMFCTNKHIGYILGTVVSDDDEEEEGDDTSPSSSDEWEKEEDDGFDSEGSISTTDSESDVPEDALWNSFCSPDPYNPQNFTATLQTGVISEENSLPQATLDQHLSDEESWCDSNSESDSESDWSADEEENLKLWNSFSKSDDPYNPLYFKASMQTSDKKRQSIEIASTYSETVCRRFPNHKVTLFTGSAYDIQQLQLPETHNIPVEGSANRGHKKVTFHENVIIHYVCNEEERKGHWEELARDRCRFQRRIKEIEYNIGHCLTSDYRQRAWERMQGQWGS